MIIYSNTGARPVPLALEKIKEQKNICCVQIKDKKYHITKSLAKEKLDDIFDNKTPYCLCDAVEKSAGELKPFYNPAIVCASDNGNWVMLKNYVMVPIGIYKQMEKENIFYLDFDYEPKQPLKKYNAPALSIVKGKEVTAFKNESARNMWNQIKDLFTVDYKPYGCYYDNALRCWKCSFDNKIHHPLGYKQLSVLKTGGWDADWAEIAPDMADYEEGHTNGKLIGRIEKFLMKQLEDTKACARKSAFDMSYQDKEYYLTEMQAAYLTLRACLYLKKCNIKIAFDVLEYMASRIKCDWCSTGLEMSAYMYSYIEELDKKIL